MAKATKVVNIFKNEYENILNDLAVATAPAKQKRDVRRFDHLTHLLEQYDFYSERVNTEKTYMVEVEGQIKKVRGGRAWTLDEVSTGGERRPRLEEATDHGQTVRR
jgi:hypothetical protein